MYFISQYILLSNFGKKFKSIYPFFFNIIALIIERKFKLDSLYYYQY